MGVVESYIGKNGSKCAAWGVKLDVVELSKQWTRVGGWM